MQSEDCPLRSLLSDQRIAEVLKNEGIVFGEDDDSVSTPVITLWALLSQVFFKQEQRSCLAAVVRIAALWLTLGRTVSSTNTGAYCRARRQITGEVLRKISGEIARHTLDPSPAKTTADQSRPTMPDAGIGPASEYVDGRLIMVDGFTVSAADTPENHAEYPQNPVQAKGLGFPLLRGVVLICWITVSMTRNGWPASIAVANAWNWIYGRSKTLWGWTSFAPKLPRWCVRNCGPACWSTTSRASRCCERP